MTYKTLLLSLMLTAATVVNLHGEVLAPPTQNAAPNPALQKDVDDAITASVSWLKLVDQGDYGASWDTATKFIQLTLTRDEWIQSMDILRKPLGAKTDRTLVDMRVAMNPPNTPEGEYMILVYSTTFSGGSAKELLTVQKYQGIWKLYTYNIAADKK